jgi:hypothetical protein
MSTDELSISPVDQRTNRQPGESVEFSALWALQKSPAAVEARLFWFTRGKGTEDVEIVAALQAPSPGPAGEHVFRFTLPPSPHSFSGRLISLTWAVELIAGRASARCEFVLAPDGREIVLAKTK